LKIIIIKIEDYNNSNIIIKINGYINNIMEESKMSTYLKSIMYAPGIGIC